MELDEIFYNALMADDTIKEICGYVAPNGSDPGKPARIKSTCFEVPPTDADNTPLPYIIITDDGLQNGDSTKDDVWEAGEDHVQASVEVGASSPKEVKRIIRLVRKAIASYISTMTHGRPWLNSLTSQGTAWDWTKPCYYKTLQYSCDVDTTDYEQESNSDI